MTCYANLGHTSSMGIVSWSQPVLSITVLINYQNNSTNAIKFASLSKIVKTSVYNIILEGVLNWEKNPEINPF